MINQTNDKIEPFRKSQIAILSSGQSYRMVETNSQSVRGEVVATRRTEGIVSVRFAPSISKLNTDDSTSFPSL